MADLKSVTVQYLRELARKHLGRGHSKLKTKKELLTALVQRVPGLAKLAGLEEPEKGGKAVKTVKKQGAGKGVQEGLPPARELPEEDEERTPVHPIPRPAEVVTFPPRPRPERTEPQEEPTQAAPAEPPAPVVPEPPPSPPVQHAAEPLVEGFFVARVAGEQELWRHHLTESQGRLPREALGSPDHDEQLGELPLGYEDDAVLLLPRDPHTLFLLWDFSRAARERAMEGLESPRAVLRLYEGDALVRVVDFALESRSFYLHGLSPGQPYRVEAHFVGQDGRSRRIGNSNRVFLPPAGPSSDTSVRFLRMPPVSAASMEAPALTAPTRTASFEEREYLTWRRVALPGSEGFQDIPERRRERLGPEAPPGPSGIPGEGAPSLPYLEVHRVEGSSEQQVWARPPGGASEQWAFRRGGASENQGWSSSPSGQGRWGNS
ncbi:MAG TPA: DUF4912 domain-containing protein [Myxococcaceae bacterium]|nr:DUF4912 domain-containing protein [Myxococcaceae bacterium]